MWLYLWQTVLCVLSWGLQLKDCLTCTLVLCIAWLCIVSFLRYWFIVLVSGTKAKLDCLFKLGTILNAMGYFFMPSLLIIMKLKEKQNKNIAGFLIIAWKNWWSICESKPAKQASKIWKNKQKNNNNIIK